MPAIEWEPDVETIDYTAERRSQHRALNHLAFGIVAANPHFTTRNVSALIWEAVEARGMPTPPNWTPYVALRWMDAHGDLTRHESPYARRPGAIVRWTLSEQAELRLIRLRRAYLLRTAWANALASEPPLQM